jgi:hypothetical protein
MAGRAGWPEAEVVPGIATGGAGGCDTTASQSRDFAEVERAWLEAPSEVGILVGQLRNQPEKSTQLTHHRDSEFKELQQISGLGGVDGMRQSSLDSAAADSSIGGPSNLSPTSTTRSTPHCPSGS